MVIDNKAISGMFPEIELTGVRPIYIANFSSHFIVERYWGCLQYIYETLKLYNKNMGTPFRITSVKLQIVPHN